MFNILSLIEGFSGGEATIREGALIRRNTVLDTAKEQITRGVPNANGSSR